MDPLFPLQMESTLRRAQKRVLLHGTEKRERKYIKAVYLGLMTEMFPFS
jgi:hypothetical protein